MNDHLLTFELEKNGLELNIHTDIQGLETLITQLSSLLKSSRKGGTDHLHLMTEEWGGGELSSEPQGDGSVLNHVKVFCWNDGKVSEPPA
jgi:hypothetical protein